MNKSKRVDDNFPTPDDEQQPDVAAEPIAPVRDGFDPAPQFQNLVQNNDAATLRDAADTVFNTDNMNVKSVLTSKHVVALVRGRVFADKHNSPLMESLCQILLEMQVSVGGRGRKDMIAMLTTALRKDEGDESALQNAKKLFT